MECYVITAILNGEQRVRDEDYLRRQMARDCGEEPLARHPCWQALVALLGRNREGTLPVAGQGVAAHGA
jgi:hypothetical protein